MVDFLGIEYLGGVATGLVVSLLAWISRQVWNKHGSSMADQWPIIERTGLAESSINAWLDDAISITSRIEVHWDEKINQRHVTSSAVREIRRKTDQEVDHLRELKSSPPDNLPFKAMVLIEQFIEVWADEQAYLSDSRIPDAEFRSKGDKIRSRALKTRQSLKKLQTKWNSGDLKE